ncbi:MAG: PIN domain-containing protein [Terracidiphilus sp.]
MINIVLDSAEVLAYVLAEPGGRKVAALIEKLDTEENVVVAIGTVNWCEILTRLRRANKSMAEGELATLLAGVELIPLSRADAELAAAFSELDRSLSLGDRACLALAHSRGATAWTTDKIWSRTKVKVPVEVLR